jgi:hypothetical protein
MTAKRTVTENPQKRNGACKLTIMYTFRKNRMDAINKVNSTCTPTTAIRQNVPVHMSAYQSFAYLKFDMHLSVTSSIQQDLASPS